MKKLRIWALLAILAFAWRPAVAQFAAGQILTAAQLNAAFASVLSLAGGTLTGPLTVPTLTVTTALNTAQANITGGTISGLSAPLPLASGGTGCTFGSGACLDNVSGLTGTGLLTRVGAGNYAFATSTGTGAVALATAPTINSPTITGTGTGAFSTLSAATANPSFSYRNTGAGGTARSYAAKFGDYVSVRDFGSAATCNGSGDDGAAFTNALAVAGTIHVPAGAACVISSNLTLPAGKEIYIEAGATISVNAAVTLVIRGVVRAPLTQIFVGAGSVVGIGEVWPEWFGATGTGTAHNDAAAIQAAENSVEVAANLSDGARVVRFRPVAYGVGSTITITPQATHKIKWAGAGSSSGQTNFIGLSTFTGTSVIQIAGSGVETGFSLEGFSVSPQTVGAGPAQGIHFGSSPTTWLIGGKTPAVISDVYVVDFNTDYLIQDARMLLFYSVAGWCVSNASCTPLNITNSASASSFTGDLTFISGQFVAPQSTTSQYSITIGSSTNGASVSGIRFLGTVIYYGGVQMLAQSSGLIDDIWFENGFQLDQTTHYGLNIGSSSSGTLTDIHLDNSYLFGTLSNTSPLINVYASSSTTSNIFINGNIFYGYNSTAAPFTISGVNTLNFSGNKIRNVIYSGGTLINVTGSTLFQIEGNAISSSTFGYLLTIGASQDYYAARSNLCGGAGTSGCVNNVAAGAHATVDGNW